MNEKKEKKSEWLRTGRSVYASPAVDQSAVNGSPHA